MILALLTTSWATEALPVGADLPAPALSLRTELAGRAFTTLPVSGVSRGFALPRARMVAQLQGPSGVRLRVATVASRSGGQTGYLGIDGESFVPRLQLAEARYDAPSLGLSLAAGVVDDLWTGTTQPVWAHPEIAPVAPLTQRLLDRADLGGWVSWTAPERWVSLTVSATSGEGETRRERNNGVDVAGLLTVRPVQTEDLRLTLRAYGREGSRGLMQSRNHRLGGGVDLEHPWLVASAMAIAGWGTNQGDGSLEPLVVSAYARTAASLPFVAYGRFDLALADRADPDTRTTVVHLGGGPRLPLKGDAPAWLGIGWQGTRNGPGAGPVAGVVTGSDLLFVQLSMDLTARVSLETTP